MKVVVKNVRLAFPKVFTPKAAKSPRQYFQSRKRYPTVK